MTTKIPVTGLWLPLLLNPKAPRRRKYGIICLSLLLLVVFHLFRRRNKDQKPGQPLYRTNSAIQLKDGSHEIFVPYKGKQARLVIQPVRHIVFESHRRLFLDKRGGVAANMEGKVAVNRRFVAQFDALWAILVPRWHCKEAGLLALHASFLILRTWLSLLVARLDGRIVRDLVAANGKGFFQGLLYWFLIAMPASYTNSMIRFLQAKISIAFRTRLTRYIHDLYLNDSLSYYKTPNLDGGVQGIDQYVTTDVAKFCDAVAALYSNLGKPFIDLVVFNYQLGRALGPIALTTLLANYFGTAWLLRRVSPAFGKLASKEARLEGEFRNAHSRLITNAEEIAFYNGAELEKGILDRCFVRLVHHTNHIYQIKIAYNMFEDFVLKYSWSAFGFLITSLPIFVPSWGGLDGTEELTGAFIHVSTRQRNRMRNFITNKRLMLSLADAGGRMMYSIKDLAELAGYTSRVYSLVSTLHRVYANAYYPPRGNPPILYSLADVQGTIYQGFEGLRLENVPVVAPAAKGRGGEELIESLDVTIRAGNHVLISGPNGVGKSAVARIVAGLWPTFRGLVSKPRPGDIFFIPQRPYFSIGTLRDQILYPNSHADMVSAKRTDEELYDILKTVRLEYLPTRDGGWESRKEWKDTWSGGEKQRINIARMLYHGPKYAIIDEATSAVSSDIEGFLFDTIKAKGITLITISHRPSLLKHHSFRLRLGLGPCGDGWELEKVGTEKERKSVQHEIQYMEQQLACVNEWRARLEEVELELSGRT